MMLRLSAVLAVTFMISGIAQAAPLVHGKRPVANQYIVLIKPDQVRGSRDVSASLRSRPRVGDFARGKARAHGATLERVYEHAVKGFSARMTARQAEQLAADPSILLIEEDQIITLDAVQTNAVWGLDRIDQPDLPLDRSYRYQTTADTVHAYIIDTGIYFAHGEFAGRAAPAFDAFNDGRNGNDCNGHGTHVAGTVGGRNYGVAKSVSLYAVRVLNCEGAGTTSTVIAGVDWITANHASPAVANMSLGGTASAALDNALRNSIASGVTYIVAAGNENADACASSPARLPQAVTVGASAANDVRASFSNYGSCVDLFAPGVNIASAWHTGATATRTSSGTSMAAPHAAGVAALYLAAYPDKTPAEVEAALKANAATGRLSSVGSNSPNTLLQSFADATSAAVALENGVAVNDAADTAGGARHYTLALPDGASDLRIATSGGTGNVDLYVRLGAAASPTAYDCRSITGGNAESCVVFAPAAGTYHVLLHGGADYSGVSLLASYTAPAAANRAPVANFTAAASGLAVAFTDASSDPDGSIVSWQWIFGDGGSSTARNPTHNYTAAGNYTVSLTVTDDRGATATRSAVVTVSAPAAAPCSACTAYTGSLAAGRTAIQPDGRSYYSASAGIHEGWLEGPAGTNFNLALHRWNGRSWVTVASSSGTTSSEHVRYSGSVGYYRWAIRSFIGSGDYRLWMTRP